MTIKFAVLCDLHLPFLNKTAQYAALDWAIGEIRRQAPAAVIAAGDSTAAGETAAMEYFSEKISTVPAPCLILSGNSDIRCTETARTVLQHTKSGCLSFGNITLAGICVHNRCIPEEDRKLLSSLAGRIVLFLHYDIPALEEESREFLKRWAADRDVHIFHGHRHMEYDYFMEETPVSALRCLDPDKAKGAPPCIYFISISEDGTLAKEAVSFSFPHGNLADFRSCIGFSCFAPKTDIPCAAENGIKAIEVRKFGGQYGSFEEIAACCDAFRRKGGRYISLHLPTVGWQDGEVTGKADFLAAAELAKRIRADGLTLHAPRVKRAEMQPGSTPWNAVLRTVQAGLETLPEHMVLGIENVHLRPGEKDDSARFFGCTPEECLAWVRAMREACGGRTVGITLDTGHVRSNNGLTNRYTSGVWYEMVGTETVAYHIHQRKRCQEKRCNHLAISDWYGEEISYSSFFWAWQTGKLNHRPMFLEMRNIENCIESYAALSAVPDIRFI